ncbi:MAG: alpha/beta hydrolase [Actinobacteria bacterium]|nr:MAG: alpha/beta hydrolase [Actinomycetota bacterium]
MEVEADPEQIVSTQPSDDLGPRGCEQLEWPRRRFTVTTGEAPPALPCLIRGDALAEDGVHSGLDRVGTRAEPQTRESTHQRGQRPMFGRECERSVMQAGERVGPCQDMLGPVAPHVHHDAGAPMCEPGRSRAKGRVRGPADHVTTDDTKRGVSGRHPDQGHGLREVEGPFYSELDPLVHWETSAGDSTVLVPAGRGGKRDEQMSLSTSAKAVLDQLAALPPPPDFATITPTQEVEYIRASRAATAVPRDGEAVAHVHDVTVDASGCSARVYVPGAAAPGRGIIVHFHGGGWLTGSIEMSDDACRFLANRSGCVVMSAAYRFAPEHPFPAAADDAYAAVEWAARHAADYGADGGRVATTGTSAGANLAAATCLRCADRQARLPVFQVLVYPPLDATFQSQSFTDNATGYYLTADQMRWFWAKYAGTSPRDDPYLSPLYAPDLRGQPPALIITAEFDPLRDDGERYASQLREAGVAVELHRVEGQIHSFMGLIATVPEAREYWTLVAARLRAALT